MNQNYSGRVALILLVLAIALLAIFWPSVMSPRAVGFNPHVPFTEKTLLKPGIDIKGGTSLLYQIKRAEGAPVDRDLAKNVTSALKKRIDPTSALGLIWLPQGGDRLEIQMPFSAAAGETAKAQKALQDAKAALEATNVSLADVTDAVEGADGKTRADFDKLLAAAPDFRKPNLKELADAYDATVKARAARDPEAGDKAQQQFDDAQHKLAATNLSVAELDRILGLKASKATELAALQKTWASYPQRLAAIDAYARAATAVKEGKGGLDSAADLKRLLRGSGVLEFHIVAQGSRGDERGNITPADYDKWVERLRAQGPRLQAGDEYQWYEVDRPSDQMLDILAAVEMTDHTARTEQFKTLTPENYQLRRLANDLADAYDGLQTTNPTAAATARERYQRLQEQLARYYNFVLYNDRYWQLASIKPEDSLDQRTGKWALTDARQEQDNSGAAEVGFRFDSMGGGYFGDLTTRHQHQPMAIVLDGKIISAPNILHPITGGSGVITGGGKGGFSKSELDYLIRMLSAGSLPARLDDEPISERTVGPQVGEDNLARGMLSCGVGLLVVALFLIGYYYRLGMVAFTAVLLNIVLICGAMAAFGFTFTLPGIAAIVLTIGTAVDANVLIFERLREEEHRGLPLKVALRNAYDRALSAIVDSNMTTIITSFFLIMFGTEEVKGFGITLIIGIVMSLFTALFVTRTIFGIMIDLFGIRNLGSLPLTFPKWDRMLKPHVDWMGLAWIFYAFSTVAILIGMGLFIHYARAGQMLDIEFAGGTAVTFELKEPMQQKDVRALLDAESRRLSQNAFPNPSVVRVGESGTTWEVTTPNTEARVVRDAVVQALGDRLKIERPSKFQAVGEEPKTILPPAAGIVLPLTQEDLSSSAGKFPGGVVPPQARDYLGGAAIFLHKLDPPLGATAIKERINRQMTQVQTGQQQQARDFVVITGAGPDKEVTEAVVLTRDEALPYDKDQAKWQDGVVAPMWNLINYAVAHPPQLQQVKNFDNSVAGDTQKNALLALATSVFVIMAYIWIRFGNLKYGTATVIALLHDVLFTIAALGFSHLLANTWFGDALKLEPFRISLTVVAGILTIMGYSMIDTIVVFDRIRENRGKYGHLSRQVINDAITQTLSRTLLTAGTTTVMVMIMYFVGGSGIHGFTFVLLVGILVGTYSSIAIASPYLLLGKEASQSTGRERPTGRLQKATT